MRASALDFTASTPRPALRGETASARLARAVRRRPRRAARSRLLSRLQRPALAAATLLAFACLWAGGALHAHPLAAQGELRITAPDTGAPASGSASAERDCPVCRVLATCALLCASRVLGALDEPVILPPVAVDLPPRSVQRRSLWPSRAPPLLPLSHG